MLQTVAAHSSLYSDLSLIHVGPSAVHGRGVIISHPIPKGTVVPGPNGFHWLDVISGEPKSPKRWLGATFFPGECNFRTGQQATLNDSDALGCFARWVNHQVRERFRSTPLENWLFTSELQWQPRGKLAYITGVHTGTAWDSARARRS